MRHFVTFRENTSVSGKVMVFVDLTRNQIQDAMVTYYGNSWYKILTEQELARLLPNIYEKKNQFLLFGSEVIHYTDQEDIKYPKVCQPKHSVSLSSITDWFKEAIPEPKDKDKATQLAAHFEEVSELLSVFKSKTDNPELQNQFVKAYLEVKALSTMLYSTDKLPELNQEEKVEMLDALADQVVTLTANSYAQGFQWDKALSEVNKSNFSKFENGKAIKNEHGKIIKGKDYFKPNLENYV